MKFEDGLYIETSGGLHVIHTSESLKIPEEVNVTVFVELTDRHSAMHVVLPRPERSPQCFVSIMVSLNTSGLAVTIDEKYLRSSTDITLDEANDYVLLWSDGLRWNVLNYTWSA